MIMSIPLPVAILPDVVCDGCQAKHRHAVYLKAIWHPRGKNMHLFFRVLAEFA